MHDNASIIIALINIINVNFDIYWIKNTKDAKDAMLKNVELIKYTTTI